MANPAGKSKDEALKLDFDRRVMLQFRGSVVTSDLLPELRDSLCVALRNEALANDLPADFFIAMIQQESRARSVGAVSGGVYQTENARRQLNAFTN